DRIFEPLYTTKRNGTGLGLAIARRLMERQGGALTVENRPEGGAAFHALVPAAESATPVVPPLGCTTTGVKRILLVEDDHSVPSDCPFLTRWFRDAAPFLTARWLWLRALGAIFFSAFYALWFQIHGLIGPRGILPARDYLLYAKQVVGARAYWLIPSVLWIDASRTALTLLVVAGLAASLAIIFNLWPRVSIGVALICFLSFVSAAQDFSGYQSDGMLLE